MLRSADHSEEEGYEQEEQSSQQREDVLAASASVSSMDGDQNAEGSSKAKVRQHCTFLFARRTYLQALCTVKSSSPKSAAACM